MLNFVKANIRFDAPLVTLAVLAVAVAWLWRRPASRGPLRLLGAWLVTFYLASTPLGAGVLVAGLAHGLTPLARRDQARGADAVVILGAGVQTTQVGGVVLSQLPETSSLRILEGARVYKLLGARLAIVSGGIADERLELRPEAEQMASALAACGVPADRILLDEEATDTHDHGRTVPPLLQSRRVTRFVLVTSPTHMRRALAVFRAAGLDPVPSVAPVRSEQLRRPALLLPNDDSLTLSNQAIYDYAAWVLYWWRGWLR